MMTPDDPRRSEHPADGAEPGGPAQPAAVPESLDPELQRIFDDPEIRAAFEAGDADEMEKTLQRRRRFEPDPNVCRKIDELLQTRRLFLRPIDGAPTMFTFNGIGTMLYGRRDFDPSDGTYFATLWFTVVFLPIVPLQQYLVRDAGGDAYQFLGSVPMSRGVRRAVLAVAALVVAAAAVFAATSWHAGRHADVHFLNGLDTAVDIELDGKVLHVPSDGRATRRLAAGTYTVRATGPEGALLEEQVLRVSGGDFLIAYNVLGAAPLIVENVVYTGPLAVNLPQGDPEFDHFIGRRMVYRANVDYVFEEPPHEIRLPSERSVVRRRHAFVLPGGWRASLNLLNSLDDAAGGVALMEGIALAQTADLVAIRLAWGLIDSARGPDEGHAFVERLLERTPGEVEVHRLRQDAMGRAGREADVREMYRRMQAAQPDSPMAAYLRARAEPLAESRGLYRDLFARFPDYYFGVHGYAYALAMSREFGDAAPLFERARQIDPANATFAWELYFASLVASGRTGDAIAALVDACRAAPESVSLGTAILYGQLARLQPGDALPHPPDHYLGSLDAEPDQADVLRAWFDLYVFGEVDAGLLARLDGDARQPVELAIAAARDPERALALADATSPEILARIDNATLVLLACEAGRLGRSGLARKLLDGVPIGQRDKADALAEFAVDGVDSDRLQELDLPVQAALHVARARRAEAAGEPPDPHLARARADDVLHTVVTRACDRWPRVQPAPGAAPIEGERE